MSITETPEDRARRAKAQLEERARASRLGKSLWRETERDIVAMREAARAIAGLLGEAFAPRGESAAHPDLTKYDSDGIPYTDRNGRNLDDGWG